MTCVLVVVSHPDDESLYCGGTLKRLANARQRVAMLTLTRGERGRALDVCAQHELPAVREAELRAAARILGIEDTTILAFPDGGLKATTAEAACLVAAEIERLRPKIVITFPPNGMNGHLDHVATHQAVVRALRGTRHQPAALYFFAGTEEFTEPARPGFLEPAIVHRVTLPATTDIDVRSVLTEKLAALGQYETQARSVVKFMRLYPTRICTESFHTIGSDTGQLLDLL